MAMSTMTETARCVTAGVDTHRDVHMVAVLDEQGAELGCEPFAADLAGYRQALAWIRSFGPVELVGVEGTGSYGAGLTRYLHNKRVAVVEVSCPDPNDDAHTASPIPSTPWPPQGLRSRGRPRRNPRSGREMSRLFGLFGSSDGRPATTAPTQSTRCGP
jgi:hypothetical protein